MLSQQPKHKILATAVLVALVSMTQLEAAHAQDVPPAADADEPTTLARMVVTAQKREEVLQDVPISVTVMDEQLIRDTGVRDIKDMQVLVPGLTVTSTQNEAITTARIRGIGTVGDNVGLESSVGVVIDGVYRPRNSVGFGDLGEIERIEVLKGPQGTVFGKNTSAGVINVMTRRPSYTQSVEGEVTVGNYGAMGVSGAYNDAFNDNAAFSVYAAKRKRDGWMDVRTGGGPRTEDEDYDQNYHTLRGKLLLEPTDSVDIQFAADFTSREENCCTAVQLVTGGTAPIIQALGGGDAIAMPADPFARVAYSNRSTSQDIKDKGVSAQVDWELGAMGGATLTSITAYREWQAINGLDFDFTTADIIYRNADEDESFSGFETFSQEFRLTGSTDSIDWMAGFFYSDEDLARNDSYRVGAHYEPYLSTLVYQNVAQSLGAAGIPLDNPLGLPAAAFLSQVSGVPYGSNFGGLGALDRHDQSAKSMALFTNNTWHATDALDLTVGLRYTREEKELRSVYSNPNGSLGCGSALIDQNPANPARFAQLRSALASRSTAFASLPAPVQDAIMAQTGPGIAGFMCLPWANALHNGRATFQERTENEWSGTLKASYRWNESLMTYASAARGYKGGGFNLDRVQSSNGLSSGGPGITPVDDTSFPGEFVNSFELGAKTTLADGNLLLNATAFHQTYDDFQLNSFLGTSFVVRSIPEVVSKGIDTEILWQPAAVSGLMLQGGLMYTDTKFGDDIPGADFQAPNGALYKLPGARMPFAPEWSGSISATYEWDVGDRLVARFNTGAKYMSDFNTGSDLDAEKHQDAYTVVNARLGFGSRDRRWMVELWGQNIFDEDYVQVGFDGPLQAVGSPQPGDPMNTYNAFLGAPATYGVTFRLRY
ncbi:TonB-dependent receptor [Luteimonas sp. SJ-92]|uniref:TonB-dependent receptor n=1 Tax=Luteimonas salinisoli TaxID=2752307 RepID=A0A853J934_9GAMM|nr:TonB-dependent receptor [Luteimonas salinisoli]NZA25209.1 TonB-dependent receptor [Luteimonas salinisoli]